MIKKKITYDEIWQLSEKVAEKLIRQNYDVVVSIGRGGLVPARILAEILDIKTIDILDAASYVGTKSGDIYLDNSNISKAYHTTKLQGKNVLIVDDCVTTGKTIVTAANFITQCEPAYISNVVLYYNKNLPWNIFNDTLTAYGQEYDGKDVWLVFPWEK